MANGCVDYDEDWCESHHDNCRKCRKEALENLKSAHEEEINHARKAEYHRGYEDGRKSVNPDEWQLEQHRRCVADRLRRYRDAPPAQTLEIGNGDAIEVDAYTFGGILSAVMYPVTEFPTSMFIDKLIYLLVGKMPEGADSAIYGNWEKAEVSAKTTASTLQKSPDLTSCHELGKLLKKTLGEAKCVHDRLKDQSKSHADLKDENQRLKGECRMYRTMLNDAAEAYKRERDRSSENCEQVRDGWKEIVRHCLDDALMYCDLLNDAKEDYASLTDECSRLSDKCREFEAERDKYKAACEAAQSINRDMLDGLKDYMELPKGEDGEHIRMGDTVRFGLTGEPFEVGVITFYAKDGAFVADESTEGARAKYCNHVTQPDPIEEAIHEYELGNLSRVQMIERIRDATTPR